MRLISAVVVVLIHAPFRDSLVEECVRQIARYAVPFFLLVSGYFASAESARKQQWEIAKLAGISMILYFVSNSVCSAVKGEDAFRWFFGELGIRQLAKFLLFNNLEFFASMMYYFFMLLYVYSIYRFVCAAKIQKYAVWTIAPLLLIGCSVSFSHKMWFYAGNWLLTGIPLFFLGQVMRQRSRVTGHVAMGFVVCGLLICVAETIYAPGRDGHFLSIGAILLSVGVFQLCLQYPALVSEKTAKLCRTISMNIFVLHCAVIQWLQMIMSKQQWYYPLAVLLVTGILSVMLMMIDSVIKKNHVSFAALH